MSRCYRCRTEDPEAFSSPTAAYCDACWSFLTDYGRQFGEWIADSMTRRRVWPF